MVSCITTAYTHFCYNSLTHNRIDFVKCICYGTIHGRIFTHLSLKLDLFHHWEQWRYTDGKVGWVGLPIQPSMLFRPWLEWREILLKLDMLIKRSKFGTHSFTILPLNSLLLETSICLVTIIRYDKWITNRIWLFSIILIFKEQHIFELGNWRYRYPNHKCIISICMIPFTYLFPFNNYQSPFTFKLSMN